MKSNRRKHEKGRKEGKTQPNERTHRPEELAEGPAAKAAAASGLENRNGRRIQRSTKKRNAATTAAAVVLENRNGTK